MLQLVFTGNLILMSPEKLFFRKICAASVNCFVSVGQLGDVMKESANLAINWVKSHATQVRQYRCLNAFLLV